MWYCGGGVHERTVIQPRSGAGRGYLGCGRRLTFERICLPTQPTFLNGLTLTMMSPTYV